MKPNLIHSTVRIKPRPKNKPAVFSRSNPVRVIYASISDRVSAARLCIRPILPDTGHTPRKLPRLASNLPLHRIYAQSARPINIATDPMFVNIFFIILQKFSMQILLVLNKNAGVLFSPLHIVSKPVIRPTILIFSMLPLQLFFFRISARSPPGQESLYRLCLSPASDPSSEGLPRRRPPS